MKIPILHLEEGNHQFEEVRNNGTLRFNGDEIYPNDIVIHCDLNKFEKNISCLVTLSTRSHHQCDRCLTEFDRDCKERFEILFHLGEDDLEIDEDNVVNLSPEVKEIDLTHFIQETLILAIPMKQLCRKGCQGICAGCGADLNHEKCECPEGVVDPRWEKLKILRK